MSEREKIRLYAVDLRRSGNTDIELAIRLATVEPYNAVREYDRLSKVLEMLSSGDCYQPIHVERRETLELAMQLLALQAYDALVDALKAPEPDTDETLTSWLKRYRDHRKQVPASAATVSQEIRAAVEKLTGNKPTFKEDDLIHSVYAELTADFNEQVWESQK